MRNAISAAAGRPLLALLIFGLLTCGCPRQGTARVAEGPFDQASAAYLAGRTAEAARRFSEIRSSSRGRDAVEAADWEGVCRFELGQTVEARACFLDALNRRPDPELETRILRHLASTWIPPASRLEAEKEMRRFLAEERGVEDAQIRAAVAAAAAASAASPAAARAAEVPPATARAPARAPAGRPRYLVQIGAFAGSAAAQGVCSRVRAAGFECIVKRSEDGYVAQAGAYASRDAAEAQARRLRARGFPARVTP